MSEEPDDRGPPGVSAADGDIDEIELVVAKEEAGTRLDALIAARVAQLSRAQVQRLIDEGCVEVNAIVAVKAGAKVRAGDAIVVELPPPEPLALTPEDIPLSILYEDDQLIAIDKPAGLVVHPAPGHAGGTLVNALLFHCKDLAGIGGVLRPGIVHRLDKDTTGAMVATKTERAHAALTAAFAQKSTGAVHREYLAIASPAPPQARGTLRTMYGRHPIHRMRFSSKIAYGKHAVTHYEVVERLRDAALVRLRLETGRTHQIRVHAADHGWPLVGDQVYGRRSEVGDALGRQALHAAVLEVDHPVTGVRLHFASPLPADFLAALHALR